MTRHYLRNASIDQPLNVLVATPAGGTGQGGIDRIMAALKAELERRPNGVIARFAPTRGKGALALSLFHLTHFCARIAAWRLQRRLDLVHINLSSRGSTYRKIVIAACARMMRVPYVIHLHGSEFRSFWSNSSPIVDRSIHALFEKASRIIVLGTPWQAFIAERVPNAHGRIVIVPNAVEEPRVAHVGGGASVHILFLGRISDRKGVPHLVKALARMKDVPGWRATLAGDGAVDDLKSEITALGLADRVTVPGWLGPEETARLLATGDILTLPSHAENLPMSIIEAMASGLGVVATPVGAVEDIVKDGKTGLLVPPGDDSALADALSRLVQDGELRQRLGAAAQAFQRRHLSIGPYADRICAVWQDAAAAHRGEASLPALVTPTDLKA
ncbi:glycosyltransferase family 4 protein [Mesorhizobium sp. BAC0120]|uniref:glycosyltransferase family 4 protein n=1 Tax=Mesorhizobium sp. BAC0120 TaxID=3090670 RepID=UPI00298C2BF7|nr:glycosyltransferase family 4 protein [Mesorhizobium sp. BAC0120]MDW6022419.1 glycosyltransferase family 4 protein [Mesorhizobium sp. BAC0120]